MDITALNLGVEAAARRWNSIVAPSWRMVPSRDTATHLAFLHPTKGIRFVSRRRLKMEGM